MAMILNISKTLLSNGATTNSPVSGSGRSLPPLGATQNTLPPAAASSPRAWCVRRYSAHYDGKRRDPKRRRGSFPFRHASVAGKCCVASHAVTTYSTLQQFVHEPFTYRHALEILRLLARDVLGRVLDVLLRVDAQQVAAL
jgi:hypothetical protein